MAALGTAGRVANRQEAVAEKRGWMGFNGLDADYELFLRCHGSGGEDLMLYALPSHTLSR